ncbi:MAG: radical SAM protein [Acidobacteria bacterium]|nr:radical SAM protein [Acidobacteriota bacterium]
MKVNEIFASIQGESSFAGYPSVFIRLTGCNLRCSYCDTRYAYYEGEELSLASVVKRVKDYGIRLITITGGEPLLSPEVYPLIDQFLSSGFIVLLETNGSLDIGKVDERVVIVMDIKCPGSGMADRMLWDNIEKLKEKDEVKFVLTSEEDYNWAKEVCSRYRLFERGNVLFSPAHRLFPPERLAELMVRDGLNARLQLQLHKLIWPQTERGV